MAIKRGTLGNDTLSGTAGDDYFYSSFGNDSIWGGKGGYDRLYLTGKLTDYAFVNNGDGSYVLRDTRATPIDGTMKIRDIDAFVFSDGSLTLAQLMSRGVNTINGTASSNVLNGTAGNDRIFGGAGDDRIWGGSGGTDTAVYSGTLSNFKLTSNGNGTYTMTDLRSNNQDGIDTLRGISKFQFSDGTYTLAQVLGASTSQPNAQFGTAGADHITGTNADDLISGRGGDDRLFGKGGNDTAVYTGKMTDYGIVDNYNGTFTIRDFRAGGDGTDVIRDIENVSFTDGKMSVSAFLDAFNAAYVEKIYGTSGNDVLLGTQYTDLLVGGAGNDRIWGGKSGTDTAVWSGKFADYAIVDNGNGSYTIIDKRSGTSDGTDVVRDVENWKFADKTVEEWQVAYSAKTLMSVQNGTSGDNFLTAAFANNMSGAHTNDLMTGNGGADWLKGGAGDDLLIGDSAGGATTTSATPTTATLPSFNDKVDLANFAITADTTATVTFTGETAGFRNTLGMYKIAADGRIYDVKVLFANASVTGSGGNLVAGQSSVDVDVHSGEKLGFFVVSNGYAQSGNAPLLNDANATYKFVTATGAAGYAHSSSELKLVHVSDTGTETAIKSQYGTSIFHSIPGANSGLNGDRFTHILGQTQLADGSVKIGFEDLWGGGDKDYDDSVFTIKLGVENVAQLSTSGGIVTPDAGGGDKLDGGVGNDTLLGGLGDDDLDGGLGADALNGGVGIDTANYTHATAAVIVDLISGGTGGEAKGDTYTSIEVVDGSAFADIIKGTEGDNILSGRAGNDSLYGRGGNDSLRGEQGADLLDGGTGIDTATYYESKAGISVDLTLGQGTGGDAAGDTYVSIERFQGSNMAADTMLGSAGTDEFHGFGGADVLDGRGGNDRLVGGDGDDTIFGGLGDDLIFGQADNDRITGGGGNDVIRGGLGTDVAVYASAYASYTMSIDQSGNITLSDLSGSEGIDTLAGVEVAQFSNGWLDLGTGAFRSGQFDFAML